MYSIVFYEDRSGYSELYQELLELADKAISNKDARIRPGNNRILYFYFENNTFVLLHMFRKQTQKTPKSEIEKAIKECDDFKSRRGGKKS